MVLNAWREHFHGTVKPHSKSWPGLPTMRTGLGTEAVPLLIITPSGHQGAATLLLKGHCLLLLQAGCLMATPTRLQQYQKPEQRPEKAFLPQEGVTVFVINTKIQRFFTSLLQLCLK